MTNDSGLAQALLDGLKSHRRDEKRMARAIPRPSRLFRDTPCRREVLERAEYLYGIGNYSFGRLSAIAYCLRHWEPTRQWARHFTKEMREGRIPILPGQIVQEWAKKVLAHEPGIVDVMEWIISERVGDWYMHLNDLLQFRDLDGFGNLNEFRVSSVKFLAEDREVIAQLAHLANVLGCDMDYINSRVAGIDTAAKASGVKQALKRLCPDDDRLFEAALVDPFAWWAVARM